MTFLELVQWSVIINRVMVALTAACLTFAFIGAWAALFHYLVVIVRQAAINGIEIYARWQSARLDAAARRNQLENDRADARQALEERRYLLQRGFVLQFAADSQQPDVEPQNAADLWQDYTRLKMEHRRSQLLAAIDQGADSDGN